MKLKSLCLSMIVVLTMTSAATAPTGDGIQFFKGSWKEALAKAKAEKKLIFLDAYTTWCGPCKYLQAKVFPEKTLGDYFNQKFVNVKMDWESPEGEQLAEKYPLEAYPTLFFIDANGKVLRTVVGARKAEALLTEAKQVAK